MFIVFSFLVNFIFFLQKYLGIFGQFFDISKLIFKKKFKKFDIGNFCFSSAIAINFSNHWGKKSNLYYSKIEKKKKEKRKKLILILNCE
jgi:hypothetical protein